MDANFRDSIKMQDLNPEKEGEKITKWKSEHDVKIVQSHFTPIHPITRTIKRTILYH